MSEACDLTAVEARRMIGARQLSPLELMKSCLKRIEATNAAVNAIVAIDAESGRRQAQAIGDHALLQELLQSLRVGKAGGRSRL